MTESGCVTTKHTERSAVWFKNHDYKSSLLKLLCRAERNQSLRFLGKRPSLTCERFGTNRKHGVKNAG